MKKIQFFLQKNGVSMVNGGVISSPKDFIYEYDENLTVKSLVNLCRQIYEDIKKMMAEKNTTEVSVVFNYLTITNDTYMCDFIAGWLNKFDGEEKIFAHVLRERLVHDKK